MKYYTGWVVRGLLLDICDVHLRTQSSVKWHFQHPETQIFLSTALGSATAAVEGAPLRGAHRTPPCRTIHIQGGLLLAISSAHLGILHGNLRL